MDRSESSRPASKSERSSQGISSREAGRFGVGVEVGGLGVGVALGEGSSVDVGDGRTVGEGGDEDKIGVDVRDGAVGIGVVVNVGLGAADGPESAQPVRRIISPSRM